MEMNQIIYELAEEGSFSRQMLLEKILKYNSKCSENSLSWILGDLLETGKIIRIGRNVYCINNSPSSQAKYMYQCSYKLQKAIQILSEKFPLMNFIGWESIQLNEFLNHQIANNTIFIEVENLLQMSAFETLFIYFDGNVFLKPDKKSFNLYRNEDTIVIVNLGTESPIDNLTHQITIEKLLVDLFANKLLSQLFSKYELQSIFEDAFEKYAINQTKLFRYARRRNVKQKIDEFIKEKTLLKILTEGNGNAR